MAYKPPFINGINPNLSGYKDSGHKFKSVCAVYTPYELPVKPPNKSPYFSDKLYTDPECTKPFTLTEAVEAMRNGIPIILNIRNEPYYMNKFRTSTRYDSASGQTVIADAELMFLFMMRLPIVISEEEYKMELAVPFYGHLNIDDEIKNDNLKLGTREGDGYDGIHKGPNCNAFTLAFGLNTAAQKVIPNPFANIET